MRERDGSPRDDPGEPGGRPPGTPDELRRRLAQLPASHPSSPWYREKPPPGSGRDRAGRDGEGPPEGPRAAARDRWAGEGKRVAPHRSEEKVSAEGGADGKRGRQPATAADGGRTDAGGGLAAGIGRLLTGGGDRGDRDALWELAAKLDAASRARRDARAHGPGQGPAGRREPYRPWFADGTGDELWLSAERTGDPWYTGDGPPWGPLGG